MWLGRRAGESRFSSLEVARRLDQLFAKQNPWEEIRQLKAAFAILGTDTELYLCFIVIYLLALKEGFRLARIRPASSRMAEITRHLTEALLSQQHPFGLASMDPDAVPKRFGEIKKRLFAVWGTSQGKAPGPDWYVAEEVCFMLNGDKKKPPSGFVFKLSFLMTTYTNLMKGLLEKLS